LPQRAVGDRARRGRRPSGAGGERSRPGRGDPRADRGRRPAGEDGCARARDRRAALGRPCGGLVGGDLALGRGRPGVRMSDGIFARLGARLPTRGSTGGRIVRGTLVVGIVAGIVKAVSLVKEIAVAAAFGRADALDAFLIAILVPATVGSVAGG